MIEADKIVYTKDLREDGSAVLHAYVTIGARREVQPELLRYFEDHELRAALRRDLYAYAYERERTLVDALRGALHDLKSAALRGWTSQESYKRALAYCRLADECLDQLTAAMAAPPAQPGESFAVIAAPRKPPSAWHRSAERRNGGKDGIR